MRWRSFARNLDGATAVEFAIVAPLIFMSVLGTFETGRALYERNRAAEACAAGARAVTLNGAADETAIEAAVRAKFSAELQDQVDVDLDDVTISGGSFKKIEVVYDHDFIVNFGSGYSGLTFTITRYAPAV
jgi:hypothetical protein